MSRIEMVCTLLGGIVGGSFGYLSETLDLLTLAVVILFAAAIALLLQQLAEERKSRPGK